MYTERAQKLQKTGGSRQSSEDYSDEDSTDEADKLHECLQSTVCKECLQEGCVQCFERYVNEDAGQEEWFECIECVRKRHKCPKQDTLSSKDQKSVEFLWKSFFERKQNTNTHGMSVVSFVFQHLV